MKKNIYLDYGYSSNNQTKLELIKETGFDGVFLFADCLLESNAKKAYDLGLNVETVHLPFQNTCNSIWIDTKDGDDYVNNIINWIIRISQIGVEIAIFHLSQTTNPPEMSDIGFTRIKKILDVCEEYEVYLALENLRHPNYMDECLKRLSSERMVCCFDIGHANAFTHNIYEYPYERYQGLIKCLHIHDNNGLSDQHLIPFSGNIEYKKVISD